MAAVHMIRWGAPGFVAAFSAADAVRYPRGARVVLRTQRGLELGEVLAPVDSERGEPIVGQVLRGMTAQDELLETRLRKNRDAAYAACLGKIDELRLDATLIDVEHLFDGGSLIFYFLGDEPPQWRELTQQLADTYDAQVQFRAFSDAVAAGCGPDCGTESATGCGSCGTGCAVAQFCSTHKH
ncbi:MAG: hypothetical protein JNL96_17495 [Planctomycetaceae bacterium]|nr:hypothetical protein [Planctomycetaceae bacterium]